MAAIGGFPGQSRAREFNVYARSVQPEFPSGLHLLNPETGAVFEVIEHTYAVRVRNVKTDVVSAMPQDMARELARLACDYAVAYGLPHTVKCGEPAVGKWHAEDDEWFCAEHMNPKGE